MKLRYTDAHHIYTLDGHRCTGISGLGKWLDDTHGLDAWAKRHVALGVSLNVDLQNLVVSHWNEQDPKSKRFVTDVCEQAIAAAKAGAAANTGTAIHRALERQDAGETGLLSTPTTAAALEANRTSLEAAGLTPEPGLSELAVVWPDDLWAGRFDRAYRMSTPCPDCGGTVIVGDVKTGARAIQYPAPIVVQLAGYALAPLICRPPGIGDWEITDFEPMPPEVCRCRALIVAIPADSVTGEVHAVDLEVGLRGLDLVRQLKKWRSLKNLTEPYGESVIEAMVASASTVDTDYQRKELDDRIGYLSIEAKRWLAARWPQDTPTLKQSDRHTPEQLAEIEKLVDRTEAEYRVPFPADLGAKF